jgi:hypothetical protein
MVRAEWFVNVEDRMVVGGGGNDTVEPDEFVSGLVDGGDVEVVAEWVGRVDGDVDVAFGPRGDGREEGTVEAT